MPREANQTGRDRIQAIFRSWSHLFLSSACDGTLGPSTFLRCLRGWTEAFIPVLLPFASDRPVIQHEPGYSHEIAAIPGNQGELVCQGKRPDLQILRADANTPQAHQGPSTFPCPSISWAQSLPQASLSRQWILVPNRPSSAARTSTCGWPPTHSEQLNL